LAFYRKRILNNIFSSTTFKAPETKKHFPEAENAQEIGNKQYYKLIVQVSIINKMIELNRK